MNTRKKDITNKNKKSPKLFKSLGMMGMCCLMPIIIIGILPLLQINSVVTNRILSVGASLICPIMMIGLFKGEKHSCCSDKKEDL